MKILSFIVSLVVLCSACGKNEQNEEIYNENNTNIIEGIVYDINERPINGMYKIYYPDGKIRMEVESKNGKPHGVGKTYDEDGHLQHQASFNDGVLNGDVYQYYPNGRVHNEMHYLNGVPDGVQKTYDENMKQTIEVNYEKGVPVEGFVFINDERIALTSEELQKFE